MLKDEFGVRPEQPLSAAILVADVNIVEVFVLFASFAPHGFSRILSTASAARQAIRPVFKWTVRALRTVVRNVLKLQYFTYFLQMRRATLPSSRLVFVTPWTSRGTLPASCTLSSLPFNNTIKIMLALLRIAVSSKPARSHHWAPTLHRGNPVCFPLLNTIVFCLPSIQGMKCEGIVSNISSHDPSPRPDVLVAFGQVLFLFPLLSY